jgi:tetratricopeptide (TPR) repeat protein
LSELLKTDITELYKIISNTTEGVVVFDCFDTARGSFAARARHHKIAAVVWERCADASQKENIVRETMKALNVNYGIDAHAFDLFVRSDRIVDCIRTLEGRISFFEQASKIDPTSPYVRQHYARMLSRSGQNQLALVQIETAIKNDQNVRVLYHTKGKILSGLAIAAESIDVGRKYLLQAEVCFNKGISLNDRDHYGFESLASLYFDWSKKIAVKDQSEAADYLSKSEEIISLGLRTVRNRESLWILSAKVQNHLGNTPLSILSLEQAVRERSGCVIARYILARCYRQKKQPQDALSVLEPVIKSSSDEFRAFIEYSLALLECGETFNKAKSILQLSTLYGLSDPRYISTYGGILYLNGEFTAADEVFSRSIKLSFPADELYAIHFRPFDSQDPLKSLYLRGEIVAVKPGYSLIKPDYYPQVICHASKYKGVLMKKGLRVEFVLAFCARGSLALYPTPIKI